MRSVFRAPRALIDTATAARLGAPPDPCSARGSAAACSARGSAATSLVEHPASVVVEDGRIRAILPLDTPLDHIPFDHTPLDDTPLDTDLTEIVLADDEVLIPGLVDTHVHVNEPGRTEWEGFASATRAAAAGGVTTLIDMPLNSLPPTLDAAALEIKRKAADGQCTVDVGFWGGAVPGNEHDLPGLLEAGAFGAKCFLLDSGVPEFPPLPDPRGAMRALGDAVLLAHAEDAAFIGEAHGVHYADFLASRPAAAEDSAIAGLLRAARETGGRVHVVHLSSAAALPLLAAARAAGVRVTVETCPHYLVLTAEEVPDGDTRFKCCPPVREESNRDLLWQGLADGVIDMIVSDHSPATPELKGTGDFGSAWGGIASLQIGLPIVWTEARRRGWSLAAVVERMATAPADLAGLHHKGRLAVGADADLAVVAPDEMFTVGALAHRHPTTPYAGRTLHGAVRGTWLRGVRTDPERPRGRLIRRGDT